MTLAIVNLYSVYLIFIGRFISNLFVWSNSWVRVQFLIQLDLTFILAAVVHFEPFEDGFRLELRQLLFQLRSPIWKPCQDRL